LRSAWKVLVRKPAWKRQIKIRKTGYGLGSFGSEYGPVAGSYEYSNEPVGCIKCKRIRG
jgi:hypothetical protein